MKKIKFGFLVITLTLFVVGCKSKVQKESEMLNAQTTYEKVQNTLINLKSYKSEATVKYISNKSQNEYETLQHCKTSGEYRIEVIGPEKVSGNVTLFDGKNIAQYNPKIGGKILVTAKESQERSEIFLNSFLKNYLNSEEVSLSVSKLDEGVCTVLEAIVPGDHPFLSTEKLWVDNTSLRPVKLVVYDKEGSERLIVTYKNFDYNVELEDSLFVVK